MVFASITRTLTLFSPSSFQWGAFTYSGIVSEPRRHYISTTIERVKHPSRGGRNLRDRYIILERSLRSKQALSKDIDELTHKNPSVYGTTATPASSFKDELNTFRGFVIPEQPKPPESDECCMSGCAVCVYDLYEDSLKAYKEAIAALRASLTASNISESEWPMSIVSSSDINGSEKRHDVVVNAFEEMEKALKAKHNAQTGTSVPIPIIDLNQSSRTRRSASTTQYQLYTDAKSIWEGVRWLLFSNR